MFIITISYSIKLPSEVLSSKSIEPNETNVASIKQAQSPLVPKENIVQSKLDTQKVKVIKNRIVDDDDDEWDGNESTINVTNVKKSIELPNQESNKRKRSVLGKKVIDSDNEDDDDLIDSELSVSLDEEDDEDDDDEDEDLVDEEDDDDDFSDKKPKKRVVTGKMKTKTKQSSTNKTVSVTTNKTKIGKVTATTPVVASKSKQNLHTPLSGVTDIDSGVLSQSPSTSNKQQKPSSTAPALMLPEGVTGIHFKNQ